MGFNRTESGILAVLPKISSIFSILGSTWIIIEVLTHRGTNPKWKHPYHRLLFAMSVYDVLECIWNFASTWPMPSDSGRIWAIGSEATCSAQGFFLTLSSAVPVYNALLAVYYMLVIKYQFTDRRLRTQVEPIMHLIAGGWAFGTAISSAGMGLYNDATLWCWIAPHPPDCKDTLRYGKEEGNCERGDNAFVFQWAFYFGPLWFSIIAATFCTLSVYFFVRSIDKKMLKYRKPQEILRATRVSMRLGPTMDRESLSSNAEPAVVRVSTRNSNANNDDDQDNGRPPKSARSLFRSSGATLSQSERILQAKAELEEDERENKFLGGRSEHSSHSASSRGRISSSALSDSVALQLQRAIEESKQHRRATRDDYPRTVAVMNQAIWYLGVFYLTHVWSTSNRVLQQMNSGETRFGIILMHSWFDPFQGFLNYLVYQRPMFIYLLKTQPELGYFEACARLLQFSFLKKRQANRAFSQRMSSVYDCDTNDNDSSSSSNDYQNNFYTNHQHHHHRYQSRWRQQYEMEAMEERPRSSGLHDEIAPCEADTPVPPSPWHESNGEPASNLNGVIASSGSLIQNESIANLSIGVVCHPGATLNQSNNSCLTEKITRKPSGEIGNHANAHATHKLTDATNQRKGKNDTGDATYRTMPTLRHEFGTAGASSNSLGEISMSSTSETLKDFSTPQGALHLMGAEIGDSRNAHSPMAAMHAANATISNQQSASQQQHETTNEQTARRDPTTQRQHDDADAIAKEGAPVIFEGLPPETLVRSISMTGSVTQDTVSHSSNASSAIEGP